jgi:hypothetical protein
VPLAAACGDVAECRRPPPAEPGELGESDPPERGDLCGLLGERARPLLRSGVVIERRSATTAARRAELAVAAYSEEDGSLPDCLPVCTDRLRAPLPGLPLRRMAEKERPDAEAGAAVELDDDCGREPEAEDEGRPVEDAVAAAGIVPPTAAVAASSAAAAAAAESVADCCM